MVATSSPLAAQAALWALGEGGTAVDAAIASDAVLGLVQPMSTGVGGDAFCLVDDGREVAGFNGSGAAPAALTADTCRAEGAWHDTSPLTVTVPGGVDAWHQLSERYGRLGIARVPAPARRSAKDWSFSTGRVRAGSPYATAPPAGGRFANPALAETMLAVREGMEAAHRHVADPRFADVPRFWEREKRDTVYTAVVAGGMA